MIGIKVTGCLLALAVAWTFFSWIDERVRGVAWRSLGFGLVTAWWLAFLNWIIGLGQG